MGGLVDQCSLRAFSVRKEGAESVEEPKESFRRGGKGRDSCFPEI